MPSDTRALTRAARARAKATGDPYTKARETELFIRTRMDETGETYQQAEAFVTDPANEVFCTKCGWTNGMVCPECPGCGCYDHRCSGWRHREFMHPDDLAELEAEEAECPECGGDTRTGYDCHCDEERLPAPAADDQDDRADQDDQADYEPDPYDDEPVYDDEPYYHQDQG